MEPNLTEKKRTVTLVYMGTPLTISGDFDSGNLNWAAVNPETNEIELQFGRDRDIKTSSKCWFHFSITGEYTYLPVRLHLQRTNSLSLAKIYDLYRPVVKVEGGDWERLSSPVEFQITADNDVGFRMNLELYGSKKFYVALCYPWSFSDNERYLDNLAVSLTKRKDIYFNKQVLIYSPQGKPIHLLAISSPEVSQHGPEQYVEHLFPLRESEQHFKMIKKPLILITSRVHPGEIGSSYSLMGMVDFLVGGTAEARKILNQFYFLVVPMLNPDGVFQGNNRMDSFGQNLNRFYLMPELEKQPSCFAVKSLLEHTRMQLYAFFDLHGHANKKSCFLFGNHISNHRLQVESVLFAKYLSSICEYVEFKSCNFSKKQMSSKDKNEDLSKEGCARVVVHKWTNSPYCYTLETGLYKNVRVDDKGIERYGQEFYTPKIYSEVGAKMIVTLFTILRKDKQIEEMRKQVALYVTKLEKMNAKREMKAAGDKSSKKEITTLKVMKDKKENGDTKELGTSLGEIPKKLGGHDEKENGQYEEKARDVEKILTKNKNYLLSLEADDDDQY